MSDTLSDIGLGVLVIREKIKKRKNTFEFQRIF
jgi:hypothetical protein